jgi:hypothetical protein
VSVEIVPVLVVVVVLLTYPHWQRSFGAVVVQMGVGGGGGGGGTGAIPLMVQTLFTQVG